MHDYMHAYTAFLFATMLVRPRRDFWYGKVSDMLHMVISAVLDRGVFSFEPL